MRKFVVLMTLAAGLSIPGSAGIIAWDAVLDGSQEISPTPVSGTGYGWVTYDDVANVVGLYVEWQGLTGNGLQAHIHCCVATPPGNVGIALDLWLTSDPSRPPTGTYSASYDLDSQNPFRSAFTTANGGTATSAMQALINAMNADQGRAYYNIHTAAYPGGEIRGNLAPIPEPGTIFGVLGGLGILVLRRRFAQR